ncbi:MAG: hypothetical protein K6T86_03425 [Pirellulales bacterium]|jgi:hypothetical protein|nr:hypothetical protein [Pirellulales bacterium]
MPGSRPEVFNREFLEVRGRILELAAALDRIDRAEGSVEHDPRCTQLRQALVLLAGPGPDRAERIQLVFSLPYAENWRDEFQLAARGT